MTSPTPAPDTLAVLMSLPECARNCMINVATNVGGTSGELCGPQEPKFEAALSTCIRGACTVKEALTAQNITQTACGIEPDLDRAYLPVVGIMLGISTVAVVMRFANKWTTSGRFWWDDGFLALAWFGVVAYTALVYESTHHGLGSEMWAVPFEDINHQFAALYASQLVYIANRLLLRHSIILFYLRIFAIGNLRPLIIIGTMVVNTVISVVVGLLLAFQCQPVSLFWTRWAGEGGGKCIPPEPIIWSGAVIAMVVDIWVLLLPLPYVARLQLSLKKRLGISFMLVVGVGVVAFSILKVITVNSLEKSANPLHTLARVTIWTTLEMNVGVLSACLPGIRLFVSHFLHRFGFTSEPGSGIQSHHISLGDNPTPPSGSKQNLKSKLSTFQGSRSSQANIRITTMIHTQQQEGPPSETYLPLHAMELGRNQGAVRAHAWA